MKVLTLLFLLIHASLYGQQLGFALEQIHGEALIEKGYTGKGVKIGVIDGGFLNANKAASLKHLFEKNLIKDYRDYLNPNSRAYSGSLQRGDDHGTDVLSMIGGINVETNVQFGLATGASYYLAWTEHGSYESRKEEYYAMEALDWMVEEGVQIINLSLGYTDGFDLPAHNHTTAEMDGISTPLTRKVEEISKEHGVLIIVSAGNDGNKKWKIVGSPADASSALTVGATNFKIWDEASYSSIGPEALPYVKPEIACFASEGTSFSAPLITGLAACLLEQHPEWTGQQLKYNLIAISHLREAPNNRLGYGVPDCRLIFDQPIKTPTIRSAKKTVKIKVEDNPIYIPIYHKEGFSVTKKEVVRTQKKAIKVKRYANASHTTVIIQNKPVEIVWIN